MYCIFFLFTAFHGLDGLWRLFDGLWLVYDDLLQYFLFWWPLRAFDNFQWYSIWIFSARFLGIFSPRIFSTHILTKRPASKIVNSLARIKFNSSKWSREKLSLVFAIILYTTVMKNESYKKATNKGPPLKLSIFELE